MRPLVLPLVALLAVACSDSTKEKELALKERELAVREKEMAAKASSAAAGLSAAPARPEATSPLSRDVQPPAAADPPTAAPVAERPITHYFVDVSVSVKVDATKLTGEAWDVGGGRPTRPSRCARPATARCGRRA